MDNNVMLDLETMGIGNTSAIIAIGAVRFDKSVTDEFYQIVDLQSSVDAGLTMDPSTVLWWLKQEDSARKEFSRPGAPLSVALDEFTDWIGDDTIMWGNGAAFDNVILANAYDKCNQECPWKFWNDRCYRTMKALYPWVKAVRHGTYHNALDDAKNQANHLMEIMSYIRWGVTGE